MTVFKNTFRIIKHHKFSLILYAVIFAVIVILIQTLTTPTTSLGLSEIAPAIYLKNEDDHPIALGLEEILIASSEPDAEVLEPEEVEDALFFSQIAAQIEIDEDFSENFLEGKETGLVVKTLADMNGNYIESIVNQYLTTIRGYQAAGVELNETLVNNIVDDLLVEVELNYLESDDEINTDQVSLVNYFLVLNYPILAQIILSVGLVLTAFKEEMVSKRHNVSSLKQSDMTLQILLGISIISVVTWAIYVALGFVLNFGAMSKFGLPHILNSLVLTLAVSAFAYMIASLIKNREVVSTVSTVVSLGVSFISGVFVPRDLIADYVLNMAKFFPSFWYADNTYLIGGLSFVEIMGSDMWTNYWLHLLIMLGFGVLFAVITIGINQVKAKRGL